MNWLQKISQIYPIGPYLDKQKYHEEEEEEKRQTQQIERLMADYQEWNDANREYERIKGLNFLEKQLVDVDSARMRAWKANDVLSGYPKEWLDRMRDRLR